MIILNLELLQRQTIIVKQTGDYHFKSEVLQTNPIANNKINYKLITKSKAFSLVKCKKIFGVIQVKGCPFLIYLKEDRRQFVFLSNDIYKCEKFDFVNLQKKRESGQIAPFLKFLNNEKFIYHCQGYDLTQTCQINYFQKKNNGRLNFCLNQSSLNHLLNMCSLETNLLLRQNHLICYFIFGFIEEIDLTVFFQHFKLYYIIRRECNNLGTRYLKRGLDQFYFAANFVEQEQIVVNMTQSTPRQQIFNSYVIIRASIPLFWSQEKWFLFPKPKITIYQQGEPTSIKIHTADLINRYGANLFYFCLNKSITSDFENKNESQLGELYKKRVEEFEHKVQFEWFDLKNKLSLDKQQVFIEINKFINKIIPKTGLFQHNSFKNEIEFQNGVIRINCIDCLDRTNFFYTVMSILTIYIQIKRTQVGQNLSLIQCYIQKDQETKILDTLQQIGDFIALQYVGTKAHKTGKPDTALYKFFTNLQRFISNSFIDIIKQEQFNLITSYQNQQYIREDEHSKIIENYRDRNYIAHCVNSFNYQYDFFV